MPKTRKIRAPRGFTFPAGVVGAKPRRLEPGEVIEVRDTALIRRREKKGDLEYADTPAAKSKARRAVEPNTQHKSAPLTKEG